MTSTKKGLRISAHGDKRKKTVKQDISKNRVWQQKVAKEQEHQAKSQLKKKVSYPHKQGKASSIGDGVVGGEALSPRISNRGGQGHQRTSNLEAGRLTEAPKPHRSHLW
jgi:hypothetical protein